MKDQISRDAMMEYQEVGQGRPVVLLHAFPLSHEMWRPQIEALRDEYRVIVPDQRGFGGTSPFGSTPAIEQMADDVESLLQALKIDEPIILGGLSMGGYVALRFAQKYPQRLRALVLCDTRAQADTEEGKAKRDEMIAFASAHTAGDVIQKVLPTLTGLSTRRSRPDVVEEIVRIGSAQSTDGIIAALKALRDRPDATSWLPSIAVPTLVIVGSEDVLTPPAVAQNLVDGIPGAQLVEIEGAGHLSNLEQPQAFNDALLAFLRSMSE